MGLNTCLIFHAGVTWCLVGLIWIIQVVHYPLFKEVGGERFVGYHRRHMALVTWVVGPLMLAESASAGLLLFLGERSPLFLASLVLLAGVWASTAFIQVPLHRKLTLGADHAVIARLVSTNAWRTLGWTLRGLCLAALLIPKMR
jgi:hypothetical protein